MIPGKIRPNVLIHSGGWRGYDGLVDLGLRKASADRTRQVPVVAWLPVVAFTGVMVAIRLSSVYVKLVVRALVVPYASTVWVVRLALSYMFCVTYPLGSVT